ncbi:hypothetical protein [Parasitella parasitica]|uniref:Reverse transcriptase domain-containing protein n=1 Tax=Parasitella parasitica TaxID=35722 RepID=A0A0B7N9T9_9FUNG|nr:hypothetical protein [Parasitella parasitica]
MYHLGACAIKHSHIFPKTKLPDALDYSLSTQNAFERCEADHSFSSHIKKKSDTYYSLSSSKIYEARACRQPSEMDIYGLRAYVLYSIYKINDVYIRAKGESPWQHQRKNWRIAGIDSRDSSLKGRGQLRIEPTVIQELLSSIPSELCLNDDDRTLLTSTIDFDDILELKKKGDSKAMGNYRPISLTNCDYKYFTKVLNQRMMSVSPKLINANQIGFIPGKYIAENGLRCQIIIEDTESRWVMAEQSGSMVSLDKDIGLRQGQSIILPRCVTPL